MLATAHGLRLLGKEVVIYDRDGAPSRLSFLPGASEIVTKLPDGNFDAALVHDCGDLKLVNAPLPNCPIVAIDHHATGKPFGDLRFVDVKASCVGILVARLLRALGIAFDQKIAECLWCSLVSDTGWFRYSSVDEETMTLALECVRAGASPWSFAERSEEASPLERIKLLPRVLDTLELVGEAPRRGAILTVTQAMLKEVGAGAEMAEGFVNYARGIVDVEVGAMLTEGPHGFRVSLRSKGRVDVGAIAATFGGGGHRAAAGCQVASSEVLIDALAQALK